MGAAEASDVDGLQAARAAVVPDLQAAELADGGWEVHRAAEAGPRDGGGGRRDFEPRRDPCRMKGIRFLSQGPGSGQK